VLNKIGTFVKTIILCFLVSASSGFAKSTSNPTPSVRMVVDESHYCLGQPGSMRVLTRKPSNWFENDGAQTITLRLHVSLYYKNNGPRSLILPIAEDSKLVVSETRLDDGRDKQPAIVFHPPHARGDLTNVPISMFDRFFQVIGPGEETVRPINKEYVFFAIYEPEAKRHQVDLRGRKVFVQLELDRFGVPSDQKARLRSWGGNGLIWTGRLRTEQIEVEIPQSPQIANCSREYRID